MKTENELQLLKDAETDLRRAMSAIGTLTSNDVCIEESIEGDIIRAFSKVNHEISLRET